jgi:hypothetical protein
MNSVVDNRKAELVEMVNNMTFTKIINKLNTQVIVNKRPFTKKAIIFNAPHQGPSMFLEFNLSLRRSLLHLYLVSNT